MVGSTSHKYLHAAWIVSITNLSPIVPPSSRGGVFIVMNVSYGRGALDVRCSVEVKFFFTVTSSENLKFPSAVLRLVDDDGRKIPAGFGVL